MEREIVEPKSDELGNAQTARDRQVQHGAVPNSHPRGDSRCVEDGLSFLAREVLYQSTGGALARNREDSSHLIQGGRKAILDEAEERFDGRNRCRRVSS